MAVALLLGRASASDLLGLLLLGLLLLVLLLLVLLVLLHLRLLLCSYLELPRILLLFRLLDGLSSRRLGHW